MRCDLIQGYYFHRPLEEAVFIDSFERELRSAAPGTASSSLYFLIYVSRATQPVSSRQLAELIQSARNFNRSTGISGCLVHQDAYFMQMLEGQREVLEALMLKIKADPRHQDVRIVIEGPAQRRVFPDWGMVLRNLQPEADGAAGPDFSPWQRRQLNFFDLAEDARTCYAYITAYAVETATRF